MIDENRLKNDLFINVHNEHFPDYKTGAKGTYYAEKDVFDCIDRQPKVEKQTKNLRPCIVELFVYILHVNKICS